MARRSFRNIFVMVLVLIVSLAWVLPAIADKASNTLNFAWSKELETLDRYYNTAREGMIVSRHICDDLIFRDPVTYEYKPLLAKSYKWIDATTMEFELRQGITFHNGEKFDADDVVYTINYVTNPDNKVLVQQNVDWMAKAEKLGPYKVRLYLKKPFPAALEYLGGNVPIYPNEYYAKVGPKGFGQKPVGTGPYKITEIEPGKKIVFVKNENYFKDSPKGQPAIGKLVQWTIPEMTTQIAELMTGGLDWIYMLTPEQAANLEKVSGIKVLRGEDMRIAFIQMDVTGRTGDTPFKDLRVRRAVNYAIDREAISSNLVGGESRVVNAACFPSQFGCTDDVMKYEYNTDKAKKLLSGGRLPQRLRSRLLRVPGPPVRGGYSGLSPGRGHQSQPQVAPVLRPPRHDPGKQGRLRNEHVGLLRRQRYLQHHRSALQTGVQRLRPGHSGPRLASGRGQFRRSLSAQRGVHQSLEADRRTGLLGPPV